MHLFSLTLFTSALALFWIQPLFTRLMLPMFGGSPAVWTTAVLFFQTALLVGYLYAHLLSARLSTVRQGRLHVLVLVFGFIALPLTSSPDIDIGELTHWPPARLLGLMSVSIGLPFVFVSATAPCLQRWFSSTSHRHASDPYFLYAASNAGSIVALLSYPIIVEPLAGLTRQAELWGWLYASLTVLVALCGWWAVRNAAPQPEPLPRGFRRDANWPQRGRWILLSAVPSALLHATTLHVTTDIASAPWIWVVPLTLYLLTFVIVFARRQFLGERLVQRILVPTMVLVSIPILAVSEFWLIGLVISLLTFFALALACHQRLAADRPVGDRLTEYYVYMALGGGLGGVAATIVAPLVLDSLAEYPFLIVAALLCLPDRTGATHRGWWSLLAFAVVFAAAWGVALSIDSSSIALPFLVILGAALTTGVCVKNHPRRLAGVFAGCYIVSAPRSPYSG
jgi:hypothetical protein